MSSPEYDKLMDHDYDGIREYDNPLPGWWTWLFWVTIFFSVAYVAYYHIGVGPSLEQKYDTSVAAFLEEQFASLGDLEPNDETIITLYRENPDKIAALRGMFAGKCAQCHRADGGGNIGPNLTDDYYKNVKTPSEIYTVISEGVTGKGMPAWSTQLREIQMILISSYVASLRGTEVADGKAPEGTRIPPWDEFVPADSGEEESSQESGDEAAEETTGEGDPAASGENGPDGE